MFHLPTDIQYLIYSFDSTYCLLFRHVIHQLSTFHEYIQTQYLNNNLGNSKSEFFLICYNQNMSFKKDYLIVDKYLSSYYMSKGLYLKDKIKQFLLIETHL